ncbi:hypothetical protein C2G38_2151489 [Gigaspora rosea]|uniref:Uncharacterized protein n=1 Tax=Gigaspora rosea TaxID=44941 RepID=A0A397WCW2_9GLOM|nr:hypothetical protein C2G38_2151489 [Gigaspora rosea]
MEPMELNGCANGAQIANVSQHFTITALPWNDLSFTGAPKTYDASACSVGNNNNLIFIFGDAVNNISFTNKFDISSQQWTNVTNGGNQPIGRSSLKIILLSV